MPPSIEGPEQELVSESISNPVTFVCDATGIPPPTLVWLKNGKPIGNIVSCFSLLFFPSLRHHFAVCRLVCVSSSFVPRQTLTRTDWNLCFETMMEQFLPKEIFAPCSLVENDDLFMYFRILGFS